MTSKVALDKLFTQAETKLGHFDYVVDETYRIPIGRLFSASALQSLHMCFRCCKGERQAEMLRMLRQNKHLLALPSLHTAFLVTDGTLAVEQARPSDADRASRTSHTIEVVQ